MIWAGATDAGGQLAELHRQLDEALRPFAPSEKPERFTGHLTLGRFKPGWHGSLENLMHRAAILRARHFGGWLASEVEIVRSELSSDGALHTRLFACPLAS